jgi:hypothetical protein
MATEAELAGSGNSTPNNAQPPSHASGGVRRFLENHLAVALMSGLAVYVLFMVPQVKNIWHQMPPPSIWWWLYFGFLLVLVWFYAGSILYVLHVPPLQTDARGSTSVMLERFFGWLPSRLANSLETIVSRIGRAIAPGGGSGPQFNAQKKLRIKRLAIAAIVCLAACMIAVWLGADSASSKTYSLGGSFCQKHAVLFGLIAIWLGCCIFEPHSGGSVLWLFGRLLSWIFWTVCIGEVVWFLAGTQRIGTFVSYRIYTIWAVAQGLSFAILLAILVDRLHGKLLQVPVRTLSGAGLILLLALATRPDAHSRTDMTRFAHGDLLAEIQRPDAAPALKKDAIDAKWFDHLQKRIESIPKDEGPVVLVAASGGGSRAAIFTTLVLETLARTPVDPAKEFGAPPDPKGVPRSWADNTAMISSVSGGSLATAYFVHRLDPASNDGKRGVSREPKLVPELRNTTDTELTESMADLSEKQLSGTLPSQAAANAQGAAAIRKLLGIADQLEPEQSAEVLRKNYRKLVDRRDELWRKARTLRKTEEELSDEDQAELDALENVAATVHADLFVRKLAHRSSIDLNDPEKTLMSWVRTNKAFDEMCLDYMAPIMQGVLSPTLGRGDALAYAWRDRFDWFNSSNLRGYAIPKADGSGRYSEPKFEPFHPSVLFNTCDANYGSRVVVGFPAVPRSFWQDEEKSTYSRTKSINEHNDGFEVSLPRAVRFSSNFPFGFRLCEVPTNDGHTLHLIDGGVVDNTGLDTFREVFRALADHAKPKSKSPFAEKARAILDLLRERGVIILEIDAGAKPVASLPSPIDPIGGATEQMNALTNAGYTNAELVKTMHVSDIRKFLNVEPVAPGGKSEDANASSVSPAPTTTLKVTFQCNHYLHGESGTQKDVMTAWSLGPQDKAQVVHRFFIELAQWDRRRKDACQDIRDGIKQWHEQKEQFQELSQAKSLAQKVKATTKDLLAKGDQATMGKLNEELNSLKVFAEKTSSSKLKGVMTQVGDAASAVGEFVRDPSKNKNLTPSKIKDVVRSAQDAAENLFQSPFRTDPGRDPQSKYDRTDNRQRAVFEASGKAGIPMSVIGKQK